MLRVPDRAYLTARLRVMLSGRIGISAKFGNVCTPWLKLRWIRVDSTESWTHSTGTNLVNPG